MARLQQSKAAKTTTTKRGCKRGCSDEVDLPQAKRPRQVQDRLFSFLELPGELRNRIYQYAIENTQWSFPTTSFRKEQKGKRRSSSQPVNSSINLERPIPYLGLSQSCTQIRSEFRDSWMDMHKIPLCNLDRYLATFFPSKKREGTGIDTVQPEASSNPAGNLRVSIRGNEVQHRDITRLVRHKVRYSDFVVSFEHMSGISPAQAKGLSQLLENVRPTWLQWIRAKVVSQVRIHSGDRGCATMTVVLKAEYAPLWMRNTFRTNIPRGYHASVGLDKIEGWKVEFAVDYS